MKIVQAIRELRRIVRSITPVQGSNIVLERSATGTTISAKATGDGGGSPLTGPFDVRLRQDDSGDWFADCYDSSGPDPFGDTSTGIAAGLVYVGNSRHEVTANRIPLDGRTGHIFLDVVYSEETAAFTFALSYAESMPVVDAAEQRYVLRLATVSATASDGKKDYRLSGKRLPGDVEVLGRWV